MNYTIPEFHLLEDVTPTGPNGYRLDHWEGKGAGDSGGGHDEGEDFHVDLTVLGDLLLLVLDDGGHDGFGDALSAVGADESGGGVDYLVRVVVVPLDVDSKST